MNPYRIFRAIAYQYFKNYTNSTNPVSLYLCSRGINTLESLHAKKFAYFIDLSLNFVIKLNFCVMWYYHHSQICQVSWIPVQPYRLAFLEGFS